MSVGTRLAVLVGLLRIAVRRIGVVRGPQGARLAGWRFRDRFAGHKALVVLAASTVAIVAISAAVIVVALVVWYIMPRGGRRKGSPRT